MCVKQHMRVLLNYFVPTCSWLNIATCAVVFTVMIQAFFEIITTSLWRLCMVGFIMVPCALCWAVYLLCTNYQRFVAWLTSLYNACSTASMLFNAFATCFGCVQWQWPFTMGTSSWYFRKAETSDSSIWFSTLFDGWSDSGTSAAGVNAEEIKRLVLEQSAALIKKERIANQKQVDDLSQELQRQRQFFEDQLQHALTAYNKAHANTSNSVEKPRAETPTIAPNQPDVSRCNAKTMTPVSTDDTEKTADVAFNTISPKICFQNMYVKVSGFPLPPVVEKTLLDYDIIKHRHFINLLHTSIENFDEL